MYDADAGELIARRYRIERKLGQGGFGCTYLCHDSRLNNKVVIKELLEKWVRDKKVCERFKHEAQVMRGLNNPNVVTVYDLLEPESDPAIKQFYIVMEHMPGGSVEGRMRKGLTWEESVRITREVCQGLGAAHAQGVVHRDIKPANILLGADLKRVKIGDFGIAHLPDQSQTTGSMHPGTVLYMAPESFHRTRGQKLDGRTDLYALGVTLYQLLTGKEYLDFDSCLRRAEAEIRRRFDLGPDMDLALMQQLEMQILTQKYWIDLVSTTLPADPREHDPKIPADLAGVVMRALAKKVGDRFPTAEAMADELQKVQLGKAREASTQVVPTTGWRVNELIARSLDAAHQNELTAALELIQHALSLSPDNVRALATMANIQMMRLDYPAASRIWLKVLELDPAYPELYTKLGQCYNRMEQVDQAIEIQKRGLHLPENRRNASLFHGLANSYHIAGRMDEAIWALGQSLQIRPDNKLKVLLERWKAEQRRKS